MGRLVRMTLEEAKGIGSRTDWGRVSAMTDSEIEKAIREDVDSVPKLTEEWFKNARLVNGLEGLVPVCSELSVATCHT